VLDLLDIGSHVIAMNDPEKWWSKPCRIVLFFVPS
jgi:hypothetical protein